MVAFIDWYHLRINASEREKIKVILQNDKIDNIHESSGYSKHEQRRPGSGGSKHSPLEKVRRVEKTGNCHQRCYQGNAEKHNQYKQKCKNDEIRTC